MLFRILDKDGKPATQTWYWHQGNIVLPVCTPAHTIHLGLEVVPDPDRVIVRKPETVREYLTKFWRKAETK